MECRHSKELKFRTKESFYKPERIDWTPLKESVDFFKRHFAWLKQNDSFKGINSVFFFSLVKKFWLSVYQFYHSVQWLHSFVRVFLLFQESHDY